MPFLPATQDARYRAHMIHEMSDEDIVLWVNMAVRLEDMGPNHTLMILEEAGDYTWHMPTVLALLLRRDTPVGFQALCARLDHQDDRWRPALELADTTGKAAKEAIDSNQQLTLMKAPVFSSAVRVACQSESAGWAMPALAQWLLRVDPVLEPHEVFDRFELTALHLFQTSYLALVQVKDMLPHLAHLAQALGLPESRWTEALLRPVLTQDHREANDLGGEFGGKPNPVIRGWMEVVLLSGQPALLNEVLDAGLHRSPDVAAYRARLSHWFDLTLSQERLLPLMHLMAQRTDILDIDTGTSRGSWREFLKEALQEDPEITTWTPAVLDQVRALLRHDELRHRPAVTPTPHRLRRRS